jgi:catechol 2,3-dioxygenase-like lactoylglutathione lyase family enzyme
MKCNFDCVFYYVSDLERSIRFYSEVLGLTLLSRDVVARFDLDGVLVEIVPTTDENRLQGCGNARLCLKVASIAQALLDLQRRGVATSNPQRKDNGILASFHDPDGNEICLWQYTTSESTQRDPR